MNRTTYGVRLPMYNSPRVTNIDNYQYDEGTDNQPMSGRNRYKSVKSHVCPCLQEGLALIIWNYALVHGSCIQNTGLLVARNTELLVAEACLMFHLG